MRITLLQQDIVWGGKNTNIESAQKAIEQNPHSDLYILPEMWSTGFSVHPQEIVSLSNDPALLWMKHISKKLDIAVAGSIAIEENGMYFNRLYFINGEDMSYYDKHHLFTYGHENEAYTPGDKRIIVRYKEFRILLQTCYDLRFPVFQRNKMDYDMILYVANWPESRQQAWNILLRARAIENQCYVAAVNRVGNDPFCHYAGGSMIISPYGDVIASCKMNETHAISCDIDIKVQNAFREKFPVLSDADDFMIK
jgi:predicted amidohydrolase